MRIGIRDKQQENKSVVRDYTYLTLDEHALKWSSWGQPPARCVASWSIVFTACTNN